MPGDQFDGAPIPVASCLFTVLGIPDSPDPGAARGARMRHTAQLEVTAGNVWGQIRRDGNGGTRQTVSSAAQRAVWGPCRCAHRLGPVAD